MRDLPLFQSAAKARDEAVARVGANAPADWTSIALHTIRSLAETRPTLICDDVWDAGLPTTHERRALGAVMLRAARMGIIERTSEYRASAQVGNHANPRVIWKSLIYGARDVAA